MNPKMKKPKAKHYLISYNAKLLRLDNIYTYFSNLLRFQDLLVFLVGYYMEGTTTLIYLKTGVYFRKESFKGRFKVEETDPIFIPHCYNEDCFSRLCVERVFAFRKEDHLIKNSQLQQVLSY